MPPRATSTLQLAGLALGLALVACADSHHGDVDARDDAGSVSYTDSDLPDDASEDPSTSSLRADAGLEPDADPGDLYQPAAGVCTPPDPWNHARFSGDTQAERDFDRANRSAVGCAGGESCIYGSAVVSDAGIVVDVQPIPGAATSGLECLRRVLLMQCLPTWLGGMQEVRGCGV